MNPDIARRRHAKAAQHQNGNGQSRPGHPINVGDTERQLSMIGGSVLAVYGLLRGSLSGLTLAAIGGALIWRGHSGHCEVYHMLGHSSADQSKHGHQSDDTKQRDEHLGSHGTSAVTGDAV
jgi:uncharacterized membrane protein